MAKVATLQEIEEYYSLCDLLDAHEALDVEAEMKAFYSKHAEGNNGN